MQIEKKTPNWREEAGKVGFTPQQAQFLEDWFMFASGRDDFLQF